ncbi:MAG TPA: type II secretion system protein GspL, partial [Steroidobacteraceae bacterium]|nr:type II secretion system protein GspL [Steroidobacteraceae bacterium]
PISPGACTLLLDEEVLFVRRPEGLPFVLDAEPLGLALDLALGAAGEARAVENVVFYATPDEYERHRETIEGLRARTSTLQVKLMPEGALPLLAANLPRTEGVNLLQGPYQPVSTLGTQTRRWRVPLALAASLLVVVLAGQGIELWKLHKAEQQLDAQIAQQFAQLMPGQKMTGTPRMQLEGVLKRAGGGTGALLPAVSNLAQAIARSPSSRVEALSFRGNALELRVVAPNVEALDGIKQAMSQGGLDVQLQSATPRGSVVEGHLAMKLGAA